MKKIRSERAAKQPNLSPAAGDFPKEQESQNRKRKTIKISVVQIQSHPAITVEHSDYLSEPFLHEGPGGLLSRLQNYSDARDISELKKRIKKKYLKWAASRLEGIFRHLESLNEDRPDLIIFPEFSIPFELLHIVGKYVKSKDNNCDNEWVVVTGNHGFDRDKEAYKRAFLDDTSQDSPKEYEDGIVIEEPPSHLKHAANSVLVIVAPYDPNDIEVHGKSQEENHATPDPSGEKIRRVIARFKWTLSPFEFTSLHQEESINSITDARRKSWCHTFKTRTGFQYTANVFVCAEALQGLCTEATADIGIVCAYHKDPSDFKRFTEPTIRTRQLAVLASDGLFGGSRICFNFDRRFPNWWEEPPYNGTLPKGDAILVYEVPLSPSSAMLGSVNPYKLERLIRISPIITNNQKDTHFKAYVDINHALNELEKEGDYRNEHSRLGFSRRLEEIEVRYRVSPAQKLQIQTLRLMAESGQLDEGVLKSMSKTCVFKNIHQSTGNQKDIGGERIRSYHQIERHFASLTHAWLRHKTESGVLNSDTSRAIIEAQRMCLERFRGTKHLGPIPAVRRFYEELAEQAKRRAFSNLNRILGTIIEQFSASSGWLFVFREAVLGPDSQEHEENIKGILEEVMSHNVPLTHRRVSFVVRSTIEPTPEQRSTGGGITLKAFSERKAILENDVKKGPNKEHYYEEMPSTKAQLSVPIYDVDKITPIGVLTLESDRYNAFLECHLGELQCASWLLLPDLLIAEASEHTDTSNSWHPEIHGWGMTKLIEQFSERLSTSLLETDTVQSLSCSVWYADWKKRCLYVRGTARFNFEYVSDKLLPLFRMEDDPQSNQDQKQIPQPSWMWKHSSYTGGVAHLSPGSVSRNLIADEPSFTLSAKAERMGAAYLISTPIYLTSGTETELSENEIPASFQKSIGVLSFYFFKRQHPRYEFSIEGLFPNHDVALLARMLGKQIHDTRLLRTKVARAQVLAELYTQGVLGVDFANRIGRAALAMLEADFCTFFIATNTDGESDFNYETLLTTGLTKGDGGPNNLPGKSEVEEIETGERSWSKVCGLTSFLAETRSSILRKIDVADPWEIGSWTPNNKTITPKILPDKQSPQSVLFEPRNFNKEDAVPTDSDHRRFLGCSVEISKTQIGIARILRNSGERPFVDGDSDLILALITEFKPFFQQAGNSELDAQQWLQSPDLGVTKWNRRYVGAILQLTLDSVCENFSEIKIPIAPDTIGVRIFTKDGKGLDSLKFLHAHSKYTTQCLPPRTQEKIVLDRNCYEARSLLNKEAFLCSWDCSGDIDTEIASRPFHSPLTLTKRGNRFCFGCPISISAGSKNADAMLIIEGDGNIHDLHPEQTQRLRDSISLLAVKVSRRLTCITRRNKGSEEINFSISGKVTNVLTSTDELIKYFLEFLKNSHPELFADSGHGATEIDFHPWFGCVQLPKQSLKIANASEPECEKNTVYLYSKRKVIITLWREFVLQSELNKVIFPNAIQNISNSPEDENGFVIINLS